MTEKRVLKKIIQIGLVVRSVEATAKKCWEDFDIGPWTFYTFDLSRVQEMTVRGRRVDHTMRMGHASIGDLALGRGRILALCITDFGSRLFPADPSFGAAASRPIAISSRRPGSRSSICGRPTPCLARRAPA